MKVLIKQSIFCMKEKNAVKKFHISPEQYEYIINSPEIRAALSDNQFHAVEIPDNIPSRPSSQTPNSAKASSLPVVAQSQLGCPSQKNPGPSQMPQFSSPQAPLVVMAQDLLSRSNYCLQEVARIQREDPENFEAIQYFDSWANEYFNRATNLMNQAAQPQWNNIDCSVDNFGHSQTRVNAVNNPQADTSMRLNNINQRIEIAKNALAALKEFSDLFGWFGGSDEE